MAKFQKGILGGFSGTIGTIVGATWRGLDIMRSRPKKTTRLATQKQLEQRVRFTLMAHFLQPIRPLLAKYFGQGTGEKTRGNLATSYHMEEAVTGAYPAYVVDFQKVILSKGELIGLQQTGVTGIQNEQLNMTWTDNSGQGEASGDDLLIIAVYNATTEQWVYMDGAAVRSAESQIVQLPASWTAGTVHCWVTVVNADGKKCSNSEYFGPINLL